MLVKGATGKIWILGLGLQQSEFYTEFQLWWKNHLWNGLPLCGQLNTRIPYGLHGVSNQRSLDYLLHRLAIKKISKVCITGPLWGESISQWIPSQRPGNAESISMSWVHHDGFTIQRAGNEGSFSMLWCYHVRMPCVHFGRSFTYILRASRLPCLMSPPSGCNFSIQLSPTASKEYVNLTYTRKSKMS